MNVRIALFVLLLLVAVPVSAQTPQQMRSEVEASMVVTGELDVESDGNVSAHRIDRRNRLPDYVVALVDEAAARWRFEPMIVDGRAVAATARMSLRLVARPVGDGEYSVSIASGNFGERPELATDYVTPDGPMKPPSFPHDMLRERARGTVYLILRIGRDGAVEDVIAERVNLRIVKSKHQMARMRDRFAGSAVTAARTWRFNPPSTGDLVNDDFWVLRIPVAYSFQGEAASAGTWQPYVPGPRHPRPDWMQDTGPDSDALIAGELQMVGRERRLLTPIDG